MQFEKPEWDKHNPFGIKYNFQLEESIDDCEECGGRALSVGVSQCCGRFLIPFRVLERLAKSVPIHSSNLMASNVVVQVGLEVVRHTSFHKFFYKYVENPKYRELIHKMKVSPLLQQ